MEGRWESNITVWFPFVYSQKWNCNFQNRILMFCLPVPTLIYLWEIYIFPGSVCYSAAGNMWTDPGNIKIAHRHMNVEIGTEAAKFPEKEYIYAIFFAVYKHVSTLGPTLITPRLVSWFTNRARLWTFWVLSLTTIFPLGLYHLKACAGKPLVAWMKA